MKMLLFIFSLYFSSSILAEDLNVVAVGDAQIEKDKIVFVTTKSSHSIGPIDKNALSEFHQILINDFSFYKTKFESVKSTGDTGERFGSPSFSRWKERGVRFVAHVRYGKGLRFEIKFFDSRGSGGLIFEDSGEFTQGTIRKRAHALTDQIFQKIYGKKSIFQSQIIFVSDRGSTRKKPIKELYMMDFDGKNRRQLTFHKGTVLSPAFSVDGQKVLYSLIREGVKKRNVNLRLLDLKTGKSELLSKRKGINSGAVFFPDGKKIAMTLSHQGNAELYAMDLATRSLTRMTKHHAPDVDPSINVTGDKIAFLSGRAGRPMIYIADPRGLERDVKRVSFVGQFNATPRFSPDGREIAFASWLDNRFDIFRVDANGGNLSRLTKDFGSNEDPTYSNDGQFIAFSSQRVLSRSRAVHNIYIMTREGDVIGPAIEGFGNCLSPRWSKL